MGLFSLSPPPNDFQMVAVTYKENEKTYVWYVCVCMYVCAYGQERSHPGFRDRSFGSLLSQTLDMMTSEQRLLIIVLNIFYCLPFF